MKAAFAVVFATVYTSLVVEPVLGKFILISSLIDHLKWTYKYSKYNTYTN